MEPVHSNPIPLAAPNSPLNALLTNFFDPGHTLQSIAKSLGLTIEGLLNYIATPEVAAALDHAEAVMHRRAAARAAAAIEQVLCQLQSLPPLPATPSQSDTDRHRKNLEATRRAADLLRKTIAPSRAISWQTPSAAAPSASPRREPAPNSRDNHAPERPRPPETRRNPAPLPPPYGPGPLEARSAHSAAGLLATTSGAPVTPEIRRALDLMVSRNPKLMLQAPELFRTPVIPRQTG